MGKWGRDDSGEQSGTVKLHYTVVHIIKKIIVLIIYTSKKNRR